MIPIELQPYRLRVSVAFDEHPSLTTRFRQEVLTALSAWLDRTYAQMWQATIEDNRWLAPANVDGLSRLTWPQVETRLADPLLDKAFVVSITVEGGLLRLCGLEWDRLTQTCSARQERAIADRRAVVSELGVLIHDLFRPLVLIESVEGSRANVRLRAGEFPPGDPSAEQLPKGAILQPIFRYLNKQREVQQIQLVPWSYLSAESSDRSHGVCTVQTGLRISLGRNTRRSESWAIGLRPTFASTRLRLTPHNNPTKALIGYQVNLFERRWVPALPPDQSDEAKPADANPTKDAKQAETTTPPAEKPKEPRLVQETIKLAELVTDRRGRVTLPADPNAPLIWMYVSSGGNMLGRFPYIPGIASARTAELPDDTLRLQVESQLELLRSDLIDSVARRALLIAVAKGAAKTSDWPRFEETLVELERMPIAKHFLTLLDAIRVAMLKTALDRKDRGNEKKITKLCQESAELIERHLNNDKIKEQRDDLIELRKADEDANAPERNPVRPTRSPAAATKTTE